MFSASTSSVRNSQLPAYQGVLHFPIMRIVRDVLATRSDHLKRITQLKGILLTRF